MKTHEDKFEKERDIMKSIIDSYDKESYKGHFKEVFGRGLEREHDLMTMILRGVRLGIEEGKQLAQQDFYLNKQPKEVAKLIGLALDKQKDKLKELFKLELDNNIVNYNTLIKLRDFIE
jgi:hypothetical protein